MTSVYKINKNPKLKNFHAKLESELLNKTNYLNYLFAICYIRIIQDIRCGMIKSNLSE